MDIRLSCAEIFRLLRRPLRKLLAPGASTFWILTAFAAVLTLPLVVATISRPLAYWDYIASNYSLIPVAPQESWSTIWANLAIQFTSSGTRFYPMYAIFYQLNLVLFHGEFWAGYLIKWLLKFAAAYLVALLVRRSGGCRQGAVLAAIFMFFHPAPFELMLYTNGAVAAVLMLLLAVTVLDRKGAAVYRVDLAGLSRGRYASALLLWVLLLGMNESAVALGAVFVAFWLIDPRGKLCLARLAPFCAALLYLIYRVNQVAGAGIAVSAEKIVQKLANYLDFLNPIPLATLPGKVLLLGTLVLVGVSLSQKSARSFHSPLWLFLALGGAYLGFISIPVKYPAWEAPRYVVPIVAALSVLLGVGASQIFQRHPGGIVLLTFFFPALTAGNIYTQHLAMNKQLDEFSAVLNRLIDYEAQGYTALKMPEEYPETEPDATVRRFLEFAGRRWYGLNPKAPVALDKRADWGGPGVLAARVPPAAFLAGDFAAVTKDDILWIEAVEKTHLGGFEYLTQFWRRVSWILGDQARPRYDVGTLPEDAGPSWFLYGLRASAAGPGLSSSASVAEPYGVLLDGSKLPLSGTPDRPQWIEHSGTGYSLTFPLKLGKGGWQLLPRGRITVKTGHVYFGIGAGIPNTATYWNVKLEEGKVYNPLPLPAVVVADGSALITAFLYAPEGRFLIEAADLHEIGAVSVRLVRPTARFGAFIR